MAETPNPLAGNRQVPEKTVFWSIRDTGITQQEALSLRERNPEPFWVKSVFSLCAIPGNQPREEPRRLDASWASVAAKIFFGHSSQISASFGIKDATTFYLILLISPAG